MKIRLTPGLVKLVQRKMRSGHYVSQSEVVCEALRIMLERDCRYALEMKRLKVGLREGIGHVDRGGLTDGKRGAVRARTTVRRERKARKKAR